MLADEFTSLLTMLHFFVFFEMQFSVVINSLVVHAVALLSGEVLLSSAKIMRTSDGQFPPALQQQKYSWMMGI